MCVHVLICGFCVHSCGAIHTFRCEFFCLGWGIFLWYVGFVCVSVCLCVCSCVGFMRVFYFVCAFCGLHVWGFLCGVFCCLQPCWEEGGIECIHDCKVKS